MVQHMRRKTMNYTIIQIVCDACYTVLQHVLVGLYVLVLLIYFM
jgi:hypothetical protein